MELFSTVLCVLYSNKIFCVERLVSVDVRTKIHMGSTHPTYPDTIYPINYGSIPEVFGGDGEEPIEPKEGQYFGKPIYYNDHLVILMIDFKDKCIKIMQYDDNISTTSTIASLPLSEVEDCYNLLLHTSPLMLTRQGHENKFEIIYPEKIQFPIGDRESFCFRKEDKLYFSVWFEDDEYREELLIRDLNTGEVIEKRSGSIKVMPDGQVWLLE